jgi:hypothetical protein
MPWKDPEKRRVYMRARYLEKRDTLLAINKLWVKQNLEHVREYARKRRLKNAEKVRVEHKRWRDANPDKVKAQYRRTYAKRAAMAPEAVAEQYLHDIVLARGGLCPKFVDPGRRGAPDRMVLMPNGRVYFVEMKRAKFGRLASWQERYHADLRAIGFSVSVLWSKEEVDEFLTQI